MYPSTLIHNKHLIILYDKPVIFYSVSLVMESNIRDIYIICRSEDLDIYKRLLQNGNQWGISVYYVIQDEADGIVDGVKRCISQLEKDSCMICLGDNFIYQRELVNCLDARELNNVGAVMLCVKRDYEHLISTIEFDDEERVLEIVRVNGPKDKYISPGVFLYDEQLWSILAELRDDEPWVEVNKRYLKENQLKVVKLPSDTVWHDVGVPNERLEAEQFIEGLFLNEKKLLGCPEEVAYRKGWISREIYDALLEKMPVCQYRTYLESIK